MSAPSYLGILNLAILGCQAQERRSTAQEGADDRPIALIQSIAAGALLVVVVNEVTLIAVRGKTPASEPAAIRSRSSLTMTSAVAGAGH